METSIVKLRKWILVDSISCGFGRYGGVREFSLCHNRVFFPLAYAGFLCLHFFNRVPLFSFFFSFSFLFGWGKKFKTCQMDISNVIHAWRSIVTVTITFKE